MSGIDLYLDFNGERIRISGARLRSQADADEMIAAINIVRKLLPERAIEKAPLHAPAGEDMAPISPAPIVAELVAPDEPAAPASTPRGSGTKDEPSETAAKRNDVAQLHARKPWLTPDQAATRLQMPVVNLRIFSAELGIAWTQRREGLQDEVRALHEAHPDWSATRIAAELDCGHEYVSATGRRLGLSLPDGRTSRDGGETLRSKVRTLHQMHPTWTARLIANELGANHDSVSGYLRDIRAEERADRPFAAAQARAA